MRNLLTGLALGFGFGVVLSAAVADLNGSGAPFIRFGLAAILAVGIIVEILRVLRVESRRERQPGSSEGNGQSEPRT